MGIDIQQEELIRLGDVPKLKNLTRVRGSKPIHVSCIYRWALAGKKGIRLETLKVGGTLCTSVEALQRFFDALTEARYGPQLPAHTPQWPEPSPTWGRVRRTAAQRQRDFEAAERYLDSQGIR
jgi:hypothetical protein